MFEKPLHSELLHWSAIGLSKSLIGSPTLIPPHMLVVLEAQSDSPATPIPHSCSQEQRAARQEQIRQGCQHIDFAAVLGQASQPGLLKIELLLWPPAAFGSNTLNWCSTFERMWALAVSIKSSKQPSGVSGRSRLLPDRVAVLKCIFLSAISGLLVIP